MSAEVGSVGVFALQICSIPVGFDLLLGVLKRDISIADLFMQPVLQPVFFVRAGVLGIRLRPKVLRRVIAAKLASGGTYKGRMTSPAEVENTWSLGRDVRACVKSSGGLGTERSFQKCWLTLRSREWAFFLFSHFDSKQQLHFFDESMIEVQTPPEYLEQLFLRLTGGTRVQEGSVMRLRRDRAVPAFSQSAKVFPISVKTVAHCFALPRRPLGASEAFSAPTGAACD